MVMINVNLRNEGREKQADVHSCKKYQSFAVTLEWKIGTVRTYLDSVILGITSVSN